MPRLTIFTPTFNRASTLSRLYQSLMRQGSADFEWLVVDDGSTDDTHELVMRLGRSAPFSVRYCYQPNGGKHVATNTGVRLAQGDLFWTVDSDDWLPYNAVPLMLGLWDELAGDSRADVGALTGLCVSPDGRVIGDVFPESPMESNSLEMSLVHRVRGDKAGWTRTEVLSEHPFPEGTHDFVPEGVVWNAIGRKYKTIYVNEFVLVKAYRSDGFTLGGRRVSTRGLALYHASLLNEASQYLYRNPAALLKSAACYSRFARGAGVSWRALLADLAGMRMKVLVLVLGPLGWLLGQRDRKIRRG